VRGGGSILLALFVASVVFGALQLGIVLALVVGAFRYPRETFGLLLLMGFLSFLDKYPFAAVATLALLVLLSLVHRLRAATPLLPPPEN
jgi:hypothetical protein